MTIKPNLSFPEYLDHPSYGSSSIKDFKVGPPAMVEWRRRNRSDGTKATKLGTAAHCLLLTPTLFSTSYAVRPDDERGDFRTKAGKAWRDENLANGIEALSSEEWQQLQGISDAFLKKVGACRAEAAMVEASIFWNCARSGLPCKGRPDWWDGVAVYDLKVSIIADRPFDSMVWALHGNGWLNQLAHNRAGLAANGVNVKLGRNVIVSPNAPHNIHLIEVRESDLDFLELDNENARRGMMQCHENGVWPGTPDKWQTIELPASAAFTEADIEGADEESPV